MKEKEDGMFENIRQDFSRLGADGKVSARALIAGLLSQGVQAILVYRLFNWLHRKRLPGQPFRFIFERFIEITCGISIPAQCRIGKGLRIHHFGGIILHPSVELGENCTLYHGVTIGDSGGCGLAARIGCNVLIGAGAKIIGEIEIGDYCIIGANTVVTKSLLPYTTAVGSPCRVVPRKDTVPPPSSTVEKANQPVRVMDFRGTYKGGGGPDKTILNSAALHDKLRVEVLVTYIKQPHDEEFQITRMAAERGLKYVALADRCIVDWRCLLDLRRLIQENAIEVLHSHDDKTLLYSFLLRMTMPGLRLLHTCHSHADYSRRLFSSKMGWYSFLLRRTFLVMLMRCHHKPVITISENTRQRLIHSGLKPGMVEVMANGIDIDYWRRAGAEPVLRRELGLNDEQMLVGTVARITYDKDLPTFYEVATQVAKQLPGTVFIIVGDGYGDELNEARAQVEILGLADVIKFTGHRTDLKNVYRSFDLFLMTSRTEGMPNTVLEAMALELPIISTNVGGVPELIEDGHCGLLAPVGDADALAGAVLSLLRDKPLRQQYGRAARDRIEEKFDFSKRVRILEDYYIQFANY